MMQGNAENASSYVGRSAGGAPGDVVGAERHWECGVVQRVAVGPLAVEGLAGGLHLLLQEAWRGEGDMQTWVVAAAGHCSSAAIQEAPAGLLAVCKATSTAELGSLSRFEAMAAS